MTLSIPPDASNYLLFSDVHLGADLVQHTRPWTAERLRAAHSIDHDLGGMLEHYRANADPARAWKLVIAGDFIDLVGMSISPTLGAELGTPLSADELDHGLGSTEDRAAMKMRAVAVRHDFLFRRLAAFVEAGHSLVFVRGNHDVELYWDAVQRAFVDALLERASVDASDVDARALYESRIEFRHWFFYVRGLLYVEHGHQYDSSCAYHHVLAPRSPRDPRHISYSFSDILVRYVVRPTRELSVDGHENNSVFDYLRLAFSMGIQGCARLGYRFLSAVGRMVGAWREQLSEHSAKIRAEHEESMQKLATAGRLSIDSLRAITQLWPVPVTGRLMTIFRSVFLDGLAAAFISGATIIALSALGVLPLKWAPLIMGSVMLGMFLYMKSCRVLEPHAALRRGAEKLKELMPARYIVMGHTHKPVMDELTSSDDSAGGGGVPTTYVNLGHWSDDLLSDKPAKVPCSHLVIRHAADGVAEATLCSWEGKDGPRVLATDARQDAKPTAAEPSVLDAAVVGQTAVSRRCA